MREREREKERKRERKRERERERKREREKVRTRGKRESEGRDIYRYTDIYREREKERKKERNKERTKERKKDHEVLNFLYFTKEIVYNPTSGLDIEGLRIQAKSKSEAATDMEFDMNSALLFVCGEACMK